MNLMTITPIFTRNTVLSLIAALGIAACGDSDKFSDFPVQPQPPTTQTFSVSVTNLTAAQPFSPINLVLHKPGNYLWKQGEAASVQLEKLAEGGDGSDFRTLDSVTQVYIANDPLAPGHKMDYSFKVTEALVSPMTIVTMLVNTNDAFTGLQHIDLSAMEVGDSKTYRAFAYDAGTEENSEAFGTMPGPADGGVGFIASRDDVDFVHVHPGVISEDDGLPNSRLSYSHRFDNDVIAVTVKRTH